MAFDLESLKVTDGHKSLAAYIKKQTGKVVKPESIALVAALTTEYRKDPDRVAAREQVKAAAREKQEAAYAKVLERAAKLAAKLGRDLDNDAPAPKALEQAPATVTPIRPGVVEPDFDFEKDYDDVDVDVDVDPREDDSAIQVTESEDGWATDDDDTDDEDDF